VFVFLGSLFVVPLVLLGPGIFLGSFVLIATGSVGRRRFRMGGGWHGVEMVVGGKKQIEREEKERHAGETRQE
jgi:hypothetical protein